MTDIEVGQVWQSKATPGKRVQVLGFGRPSLDGPDRAEVEDVRTYRKSWIRTVGWSIGPVRLAGYELVDKCELCSGPWSENHSACRSSHGKVLCCTCYRRSHFVEAECCPAATDAVAVTS